MSLFLSLFKEFLYERIEAFEMWVSRSGCHMVPNSVTNLTGCDLDEGDTA